MLDGEPSFVSPEAFADIHLRGDNRLSQQFWANMIDILYSEVFQSLILPRQLIYDFLRVSVAPQNYQGIIARIVDQMVNADDL
jgi:hypothetical protein